MKLSKEQQNFIKSLIACGAVYVLASVMKMDFGVILAKTFGLYLIIRILISFVFPED